MRAVLPNLVSCNLKLLVVSYHHKEPSELVPNLGFTKNRYVEYASTEEIRHLSNFKKF
jgi:hypothetical protein